MSLKLTYISAAIRYMGIVRFARWVFQRAQIASE